MFELRMPPKMNKPRPQTAQIVAKQVTRVATPGTDLHGESFKRALIDCAKGRFSSIKKCAAYHKLAYSTLYTLFTRSEEYKGSGGANKVLTN